MFIFKEDMVQAVQQASLQKQPQAEIAQPRVIEREVIAEKRSSNDTLQRYCALREAFNKEPDFTLTQGAERDRIRQLRREVLVQAYLISTDSKLMDEANKQGISAQIKEEAYQH